MRLADRISGIILMGFALFWFWTALHFRRPLLAAPGSIGPSAYPLLASGILFLLSALLVWRSFGPEDGAVGTPPFSLPSLKAHVLPVAGNFLGYLLLLNVVGYLLATFLLVIVVGTILGTPAARSAAAGVLITAILFGLFRLWLGVPLPSGPLGG
ncbi:MAG: tripartite tricarboxylate transporter TctB family protein [Firmicutes bacterium]|nr:tripartite tricarboxylate transporter TctB family protein [Bacillota bacterium]